QVASEYPWARALLFLSSLYSNLSVYLPSRHLASTLEFFRVLSAGSMAAGFSALRHVSAGPVRMDWVVGRWYLAGSMLSRSGAFHGRSGGLARSSCGGVCFSCASTMNAGVAQANSTSAETSRNITASLKPGVLLCESCRYRVMARDLPDARPVA